MPLAKMLVSRYFNPIPQAGSRLSWSQTVFFALRVNTFLELQVKMDPCREKDTDITLFRVVYGLTKFREGKVPPCLLCHPHFTK